MDIFIYKLLCSFSFFLHFILFKGGYPLHTPTLTKCRYPSTPDSMGDYSALAFGDSEDLVNHAEYEGDEDCEVPGELARLLQQEERVILPHEELLETINLGTEEDRKEVQVGANLEPSVKERLIQLLNEYVEIFAWSYEDMPG